VDAAYNAGGLRVWHRDSDFFFVGLNGSRGLPYVPVERTDAPEVFNFLKWYYTRG
jgi:hypothetical protein